MRTISTQSPKITTDALSSCTMKVTSVCRRDILWWVDVLMRSMLHRARACSGTSHIHSVHTRIGTHGLCIAPMKVRSNMSPEVVNLIVRRCLVERDGFIEFNIFPYIRSHTTCLQKVLSLLPSGSSTCGMTYSRCWIYLSSFIVKEPLIFPW